MYEGCQGLLEDGQVCFLGVAARRARQTGVYRDGINNRGHSGHVCQAIGEGTLNMFCFMVKTSVGRCQVWEESGLQLFGISGVLSNCLELVDSIKLKQNCRLYVNQLCLEGGDFRYSRLTINKPSGG